MSSTNTISSPAGDVSVTIGSNPDTYQLISVSDIQYKFDINDVTSDTISSVPFIIANCTITCINEDDSGSTTLEDSELGTTRDVDLTIGSDTFPLEYRQGQYDVSDMRETVTFECVASDRTNTNTATSDTVHDNGDGTDRTAYPIQQVLESALNDFGVSTYMIETSHFDDNTFPAGPGVTVWAATIDDSRVLRDCAAVEGAYYGIFGGTGFYIRRGSTNNKVTITQSDILGEPSRDISYPDLKDLDITFTNADCTFTGGTISHQDTETVDSSKRQSLTFTRDTDLLRVLYDDGDARLENDDSTDSNTEASSVLDTGTEAYKDVLRASAPFTIKIRVEGFDTIKPWQPFDITDTTGKLGQFTGKTYRPLELIYSINNYIDITAYQIA